jgi:hypothetical protein
MFENRVLKKICGPEREEVNGDWRKLYNAGLHNLQVYSFQNIIRMIGLRMRLEGHVAHVGGKGMHTKFG